MDYIISSKSKMVCVHEKEAYLRRQKHRAEFFNCVLFLVCPVCADRLTKKMKENSPYYYVYDCKCGYEFVDAYSEVEYRETT